ncbi:MAG: hypothetical protein JWP69_947 [Flaviaesturariibacter sp.]|nr:hypothetical protein [Flaviaesturariibacter sp.]
MAQNNPQTSQDQQTHSHQEGQQNNIAQQNIGKNNSRSQADMNGGREGRNNQVETESDRANQNEDADIRGGNSSI